MILVIGDVINDVVVKPLQPITRDSDTTSAVSLTSGGSGANLAAWLALLGADVRFAGRAGERDAAVHTRALAELGVEARIAAAPGEETGTIVVLLEGDIRTMFTDRKASGRLGAGDLPLELLDGVSWLHLSGYCLLSPSSREACLRLFARAGEAGIGRSVDPNSVSGLRQLGASRFLEWTAGATVVLPNLAEGRALSGGDGPEDVAALLLPHYDVVALKLGAQGVLVARTDGWQRRIEARPVQVADPTGAGDAFAAGLLTVLSSGGDLDEATTRGLDTAARAITHVGGWPLVGEDPP